MQFLVIKEVCQQPKEPGPCEEYVLRWHYSEDGKRCTPFYYGGCEGNENNFETYQECYDFCTGISTLLNAKQNVTTTGFTFCIAHALSTNLLHSFMEIVGTSTSRYQDVTPACGCMF